MELYLEIAGGALVLLLLCVVPWLIWRRRGMKKRVKAVDVEGVEVYELKMRYERLAREHDAKAKMLQLQVGELRDQVGRLNREYVAKEKEMGAMLTQLKGEKHSLELMVSDLKKQLSYYR